MSAPYQRRLRARLRAALVDVTYEKTAADLAFWTGLPIERAEEIMEIARGRDEGTATWPSRGAPIREET